MKAHHSTEVERYQPEPEDTALFAKAWPKVSLRRREALLEDLEEIHLADDLLCFEAVARLALVDKDPSVRLRAIRILREYELVDILPTFIEMTEKDPDHDVRAGAASALGMYVYMGEVEDISAAKLKRVEECLLGVVSSQQPTQVRRSALEALGFSSRKEVVSLIEKAYASDDMDWVITALFVWPFAKSRWKPQVLKMITDPRPGVRAEAASAAGELEIASARRVLLDLLEDPDFDVRMATIWALSQIGGKSVRESLETLLKTTDDAEEVTQIENALENLDFTEELQDLDILDIPEDMDESSDDEFDDSEYDLISEDDEA
jgi:hypothetical protein